MATLKQAVATSDSVIGPRQIQLRDPATDEEPENLESNSAYSSSLVADAGNIFIGADLGGPFPHFVEATRLNDPAPGEFYEIIDTVSGLYPPGMETWNDVEVSAMFATGGLGFIRDKRPDPFDVPGDKTVAGVAPHPRNRSGTPSRFQSPRSPDSTASKPPMRERDAKRASPNSPSPVLR